MRELGLLLPIVTPCDARGEVDVDGLKALCAHFNDAGCHSLFAAGSTGRGPWFSRPQRETICRTAADCRRPGAPVFAGCMASGLPDMLENARAMAGAGALTAAGRLDWRPAVTHRVALTDIHAGLDLMKRKESLKVMVYPERA